MSASKFPPQRQATRNTTAPVDTVPAADIAAENIAAENIGDEDIDADEIGAVDSGAKDSRTKDSRTKDSRTKDIGSEEMPTKVVAATGNGMQDLKSAENLEAAYDGDYDEPPSSTIGRWLQACLLPFEIVFSPLDQLFQRLFSPRDADVYALADDDFADDGNAGNHNAAEQLVAADDRRLSFWTGRLTQLKSIPAVLSPGIVNGLVAAPKFLWLVARQDKRDLLYVLPAAGMLLFFAFVFYRVVINADAIERKYRLGARDAMEAGDFQLAKTYFARIAEASDLSRSDRLQWAIVLAQTGDSRRAERILTELAPDDVRGYAPAHRVRALELLSQLNQSHDPLVLQRLRWHLDKGNDNSEVILKGWAAYYLAVNDPERALQALRQAAASSPELLITMADILRAQDRTQELQAVLKSAAQQFEAMVNRDPHNSWARVQWASALIRLEDYAVAERVLQSGYALQPDAAVAHALADYYIVRYDQTALADAELQQQFQWLRKALAVVPNYQAAFQRITELHMQADHPADAAWIEEALMDLVTSGQPSALAHIALSNVLWQEEKFTDARWHVEQAYRLEPQSLSVVNNLAWMLAHHDPPDLDRAHELAQIALEKSPENPDVRDTYGTVLMLQAEYDEAIVHFEKALAVPALASELHHKLAICYRHIGKTELARLHEKKASSE